MNDDLLQALRNRTPIETDPKLDTLAKLPWQLSIPRVV